MQERRADLQGIRAIAVAMVVFYHLDLGWLPGGFVGVDVFFVLSGFLITRLLYVEAAGRGTIDLAGFWLRRARRLLPNAVLTLAFILAATWLLLPPYRWHGISRDVLAAATFLSNFRFSASATDYFHFDDPPTPVLHFWSLSIEEQFYFALPMALFLLLPAIRQRPRLVVSLLLAATGIVSFAASLWVGSGNQPAAFFGTHTRVWQLAIGGLLGINFDLRQSIPARAIASWAGMAAIVYAAFAFSDTLSYPGLYALAPTLGAALLILGLDAERAAPLRLLLSTLPMRWAGDRSYSLYLWHWPIIIFAREAGVLSGLHSILLIAPIVLLAEARA